MSNWLDSAEDAVKGAFCSYLSNVDRYFSFWSELGIPTDQVNPQLKSYVCDDDGPPGPPPPPFTGGQCDVDYDVSVNRCNNDGSPGASVDQNQPGPIGPLQITNIVDADEFVPNRKQYFWRYTYDGGNAIESASSFSTCALSLSVVRSDGMADNCGDLPPDIPPVEPVTQPISFTYTDASDNSVNVNADLTIFAPIFAPIGIFAPIIRVPIRINGPNFDFSGNLNLPDLNIDIYPSPARPSTGVPDPVPDVEPDSPDSPTTEEDDSTRELLGILVRSQPVGETRTTEIAQPDAPTLYVPRLANAWFRVRFGRRYSWMGPYDVKATNTFVPVPPDVVVVATRAIGEQGWQANKFEIYKSSEPDNSEPGS